MASSSVSAPSSSAGAAGAAATSASAASSASESAKSTRAARGAVNMPSRAIAAVLLRASAPVRNRDLYFQAKEYGNIQHHKHFKHVLKMMKVQERVRIIPGPPEKIGGRKLTYCTQLTRRGEAVYTEYLGEDVPLPGDGEGGVELEVKESER